MSQSEEMPPPSWRSLASAASRSIKGYITQQRELKQAYPSSRSIAPPGAEAAKRQSWSQWAGQKLRRGSQAEYDASGDRLSLFPGWAVRRYREPPKGSADDTPFDIDVFVSGYASKLTGVGFNTRAGRTFLRLAKSFAALPKLPNTGMSKSTEDLLTGTSLPPLPDEITEESEMQLLEEKLRRLQQDARSVESTSLPLDAQSISSNDSSTSRPSSIAPLYNPGTVGPLTSSSIDAGTPTELRRWHANLEERLHPFWSSVLSNRIVRVSLYAADPSLYDSDDRRTDESSSSQGSVAPEKRPIDTREVITAVDGSFQLKFSVPWTTMCVHPAALQIAFGGTDLEQEVFVVAELLAPPSPGPATLAAQYPYAQYQPRQARPAVPPNPVSTVSTATAISVPLTFSSVRVISDIDDTVKLSGILTGARAVFRNVFVKDLRESVIRGMGEWYTGMWKRGVRFHYVSNGPFELLPVVNAFLQLSQLPPGSVRLRSYGGRSLFNGLLSAPAMRKRSAVVDVLNHFPDARFFLVGDSGEQDLELYAEIGRERPDQILAIFIRDASVRENDVMRPLDDPTGADAARWDAFQSGAVPPGSATSQTNGGFAPSASKRASSRYASRSMSEATPGSPPAIPSKATRSFSGLDLSALSRNSSGSSSPNYFSSTPRSYSPITEEPPWQPTMTTATDDKSWPPPGFSKPPPGSQAERRESRSSSQTPSPTDAESERKRWDLQTRVWKARLDVPPQIPLRMFREPEECVEVNQILDRLQLRRR
ncbi:hypothetical protein GSI_13066 [Ganoderma sinense ZZ0214-1]|uniref:Phosphatidate phosphatase APP1 catalytic domain-containing protein n=1 Tax=Ganoderma sinense ZZ0214-1 TaxID=1077348 RepID=A0A2G8RUI7_9APHY|nr:hypothetical protein GSI_13066 [Ganoderma sinense ZZ0214-1]